MVASQVISNTLSTAKDSLRCARELAAKAFSAGASDNVSLVVARRANTPSTVPRNRQSSPIGSSPHSTRSGSDRRQDPKP
jgi:hypothetical protein